MMNKKLNDDHNMPAWAIALSEDVQMLSILQEKKSRKRARKDKRENGKSEKRQEPVKPPSVVTKPPAVPPIKPGNSVNNCLQNKFNGRIRGTICINGRTKEVDFLLDSGAGSSIMCVEGFMPGQKEFTSKIYGIGGYKGSATPIMAQCKLSSDKEYDHPLRPVWIQGESAFVILGRDFMAKEGGTFFDWANHRIMLGEDWVYYLDSASKEGGDFKPLVNDKLSKAQSDQIQSVINRFPDLFAQNPKAPRECTMSQHAILSKDDRPSFQPNRRRNPQQAAIIDEQVKEMLKHGIIRPSKSPYNSNIHLVPKKDGSQRFCIDYRNLNKNTVKDSYPLPNVEDMISNMRGCKYFTQLDLASGYWCVPIREEDRKKTAFSTGRGKYEMCRMPFGLINAGSTFQRGSDEVVAEVKKRGHVGLDDYVDNFMIFSKTFKEHLATIACLMEVLEERKYSLRKDKCEFAFNSMEVLGFVVDGESVCASPDNVSKVFEFPVPTTRKELQRFLGLTNFNRRFVKDYAAVSRPLAELTSCKVDFKWEYQHQLAFQSLKDSIAEIIKAAHPDFSRPFHIRTDASDIAVGAALYQIDSDGKDCTIAYYSKALQPAQRKWSATEKEMWGIVAASRKFYPYCYSKVTFHTDHQPLTTASTKKDHRGKFTRWLMELQSIDYDIQYIKGTKNVEADYLSRIHTKDDPNPKDRDSDSCVFATSDGVDIFPEVAKIAEEQMKDPVTAGAIKQLRDTGEISSGPFKRLCQVAIDENSRLLMKGGRIVLPKALLQPIIRECHGQYHPGVENTLLLIKSRFICKDLAKHVAAFVRDCRTCAQTKPGINPKAAMVTREKIPGAWECLAIDIATMPCSDKGNVKILEMVDLGTKFTATAALKDEKAETIKEAIWSKWIPYKGCPVTLLSDQGPSLDGKVIDKLCSSLGIKKRRSSPFHPQGNSSAERSIGSLKVVLRSLMCSRNVPVTQWDTLLDEATLATNCTVNKTSKFSPFKCALGHEPRLPLDNLLNVVMKHETVPPPLIQKNAHLNRIENQASYKKTHDRTLKEYKYKIGDKVLLKRTFGKYPKSNVLWKESTAGPYVSAGVKGPVNYLVGNSKGKEKIYHHDMLKHAKSRVEAIKTLSSIQKKKDLPQPRKELQSDYYSQPVQCVYVHRLPPSIQVETNVLDNIEVSANNISSSLEVIAGGIDALESSFSNNLDTSFSENLSLESHIFNDGTVDNINNSIEALRESFATLENARRPSVNSNSNRLLDSMRNFDDVDHGSFSANVLQSNPTVLRDTHVSKSGRVSKRPDRLIDKFANVKLACEKGKK